MAARLRLLIAPNCYDAACGVSATEQLTLMTSSILRGARPAILLLAALIGPSSSALSQTLLWEVEGLLVAGIDDLDGDGLPDVIVGATPSAMVLSGGTGAVIWTFTGLEPGDSFGTTVANAGDVDNDGTSDIIVGAAGGYVQVFSGSTGAVLHTFIGPERFNGESEWLGNKVTGVGDVNLDGHCDVMVGGYNAEIDGMYRAGRATVFSGQTGDTLFEFNGSAETVGRCGKLHHILENVTQVVVGLGIPRSDQQRLSITVRGRLEILQVPVHQTQIVMGLRIIRLQLHSAQI